MSEILQRHFAAMDATLAIMQTQLAAAKHAAQMEGLMPPPPKPPALPSIRIEGCEGVPEAHCARVNDDARVSKASFGAPNASECKGCGSRLDL